MLNFYIVVFLVGVFYTFVSLIISGVSGAFHSSGDVGAGAHGHLGGHGHAGAAHADVGHIGHSGHINGGHAVDGSHVGNTVGQHGDSGSNTSATSYSFLSLFMTLLNPIVVVSFLTVFGGIGIMGIKFFGWDSSIVFIFAFVAGVFVSAILYNFIAKPLYRSENTTDVSREELIGTYAEVTTNIIENGYGTIKYTVNSIRFTAPAKHIEDKAVKQGERVFICKIEDNTFYISEVSSILN